LGGAQFRPLRPPRCLTTFAQAPKSTSEQARFEKLALSVQRDNSTLDQTTITQYTSHGFFAVAVRESSKNANVNCASEKPAQ
jgi:hypothetical protein